jgi:hypothetical protein
VTDQKASAAGPSEAASGAGHDHDHDARRALRLPLEILEGTLEVHEAHEHIEHAHHQNNKRAAIMIVALAAALAITEMAGKEAQFSSIAHNIDTSDTFAYYQAKTMRSTTLRTAIDAIGLLPDDGWQEKTTAARTKLLESWKATADRLDSDEATHEGRKELLEKAKQLEEMRDHEIHAYHDYEYAAAALQLAIVMASASVITELTFLEIISGGLGLVGLAFGLIGWLAPAIIDL